MAVSVSTQPTLTIGQPQRLFSSELLGGAVPTPTYDVTPDGQRFVLAEAVQTEHESAEAESGDAPRPSIRVVQNWHEEFRDRED